MLQIAVYGKGGIGKSTTSSNLSYSLAKAGKIVMQIGCDPKHDSTKYLIGAKEQKTVLDYVRSTTPSERKLEDVMLIGSEGVMCIEAGGPEPGIGCAGRGILTTFDVLEKLGLDNIERDITLYDVLGDVVCGGFAVPMRNEYADAVYIVTSGEFMAMYAANNILRGLLNFGTERPRVAGLILNRRNVEGEGEIVAKFAKAVGLPIIVDMPRSKEFLEAERIGKTVSECFPDSVPAGIYRDLAEDVISLYEGRKELYMPHPLSDEQLNDLAAGREIAVLGNYIRNICNCNAVRAGKGSCASRGAVFAAGKVYDLPIVIHGPASCGYVMTHGRDLNILNELGMSLDSYHKLKDNVFSTRMTNNSAIYGGHDDLKRLIRQLADKGERIIMVVTTCVPGIIGDNLDLIKKTMEEEYEGLKVILVKADGNLAGGSEDGRLLVVKELIDLIDESRDPTDWEMNLIDDNFVIFGPEKNERYVNRLMSDLGFSKVNKLFDDVSLDEIVSCKKNILNVKLINSPETLEMCSMMEGKGMNIFPLPIPKGLTETLEWLDVLGRNLGIEDRTNRVAAKAKEDYRRAVDMHRPFFEGKTADIITGIAGNDDWMIEVLTDAGVRVRHVYVMEMRMGYGGQRSWSSRYMDRLDVVRSKNPFEVRARIEEDEPDIVIGGGIIGWKDQQIRQSSNGGMMYTHYASIEYLEYLHTLTAVSEGPGWNAWAGEDLKKRFAAPQMMAMMGGAPGGAKRGFPGMPPTTSDRSGGGPPGMPGNIADMMGSMPPGVIEKLRSGKVPEGMPPFVADLIKSMPKEMLDSMTGASSPSANMHAEDAEDAEVKE